MPRHSAYVPAGVIPTVLLPFGDDTEKPCKPPWCKNQDLCIARFLLLFQARRATVSGYVRLFSRGAIWASCIARRSNGAVNPGRASIRSAQVTTLGQSARLLLLSRAKAISA
jgi:hypothetical protein